MIQDRSKRLPKRPINAWALSNMGNLWRTFRTRQEAIQEAEYETGEPWGVCREYMEVWRCEVVCKEPAK
jgi:hypothetical protein